MIQEERKLMIIDILSKNNTISVKQLVESLGVSPATIRRDLQELESEEIIKRSHGGAMLRANNMYSRLEPKFDEKDVELLEEKNNMAKIASSFVEDGDSIILDSGTTTIRMIPFLLKKKNLTIITNSIVAANILTGNEGIDLIVTGGTNRIITKALVGNIAVSMLNNIYADKVFLGTNGIHYDKGLTTPNIEEAMVKNAMISSAEKVFLLADNRKFDMITFAKFSEIECLDYIISDINLSEKTIEKYEALGPEIIISKEV